MPKERIEFLDSVKGFAILLVVFCHTVLLSDNTFVGNVLMALASAGVPCFMMTTGALMHHTERFSWQKYFNKLIRLYAVIVVWRLIYFLVAKPIEPFHLGKIDFVRYLFFFHDFWPIPSDVMWYMVAYYITLLIYPATWFLFRKAKAEGGQKVVFALMAVAFASSFLMSAMNSAANVLCRLTGHELFDLNTFTRILPFNNYPFMIFYFLFGAFIFEYKDHIIEQARKRIYVLPLATIAGLTGLMLIKFYETESFLWSGNYFTDGYTRVSTIFLAGGIFMLFMTVKSNPFSHFLAKYVGPYTMGIYFIHYLVLFVCSYKLFWRIPVYGCITNLVKTAVCAAICVIITMIMRKIPYLQELVK